MELTLGYSTLYALCGAIGVPILVSFVVWAVIWLCIRNFSYATGTGEGRAMPRILMVTLFEGQYYPFLLLQPLHWAFPWVVLFLIFALPAGILIDNGIVVGWGAVSGFMAMLVVLILLARYVLDSYTLRRNPWWFTDLVLILYLLGAALAGVTIENWLI